MSRSFLKSSILLRMAIIAFLTLLLLIPAAIVESLIKERSERRDSAIHEVSEKWGLPQVISGPILTIPIRHFVQDEKGKEIPLIEHLHILPDSLAIEGQLSTETRARGIYEVILYNSQLSLSGGFNLGDISSLLQNGYTAIWNDAVITIGISDPRGIKENVQMVIGEQAYSASAGVRFPDIVSSGITVLPKVDGTTKNYSFSFSLNLNGSSEIQFCPLGRQTTINLKSSWPSPSFTGAFLPDSRSLSDSGFSCNWNVLELNRNFPQFWLNKRYDVSESVFGVRLLQSVDEYQKTLRTAKYAILIISLTFLAFFLSEVLSKETLHPIHYSLVGLCLVLFYLLLIALSEHFGFDSAYFISATSIIVLIGLYSMAIAAQHKTAVVIATVLCLIYVFLYIVLQNEDYALLIGSLGLLTIMAIVMYLTRKVDWYTVENPEQQKQP
ncbi:cell envelope integrity protein CreD [bacterium]|nr:cell envelope integrity protein CreD [bacterium]